MTAFDISLVPTDVAAPFEIGPAEAARLAESLRRNGVALLRGFVPAEDVADLRRTAEATTSPDYVFGRSADMSSAPLVTDGTRDFRHPFLVSGPAARLATSGALLDAIEGALGDRAIVHHGLFQRSLIGERQILDWHIDCGSNKALNGLRKFDDFRIRTILYLSDVTSGGFSYIAGSGPEALKAFLALPPGTLFPVGAVPADESRRITFNEKAGSLILFDTHGLHRPEVPREERFVLNVWYARRDFAGGLPPALFSLALVPPENRDRLYVFENQRGFDPLVAAARPAPPPSVFRRVARRLLGA